MWTCLDFFPNVLLKMFKIFFLQGFAGSNTPLGVTVFLLLLLFNLCRTGFVMFSCVLKSGTC